MKKNKQLFFSHTWKPDNLGRNTHERVYEIVKKIRDNGWTTWFDEEDMGGNIDAAMAEGIDNADAIMVCLTETYCKKINDTAKNPRNRDNCLKEWTYANARNKLLIPIIMEPCLLNQSEWPPGIVSLYLGSTLYIDASKDDINNAVIFANNFLLKHGIQPNNKSQKLYINIFNKIQKNIDEPISPLKIKGLSIISRCTPSSPKHFRITSPKLSPNSIQKTQEIISPNSSPNSSPKSLLKKNYKLTSKNSNIIKTPQLTFRCFKSKKKNLHRPAPELPNNITNDTSNNTSNNIINDTSNNIINDTYIVSNNKSSFLFNKMISETNVLSNYKSNDIFRKSKSTGNFLNLCI